MLEGAERHHEHRSGVASAFSDKAHTAKNPDALMSMQVGLVRVACDTKAHQLSASMAELLDTFTPSRAPLSPSVTTKVSLLYGAESSDGDDTAMPVFRYDAAKRCYEGSNDIATLSLTTGSSVLTLKGRVRVGREVGSLFPKFLLRLATAVAVIEAESLLVHGCAMVDPEGRAFLFLGASGDGKTTMTRRLPGWSVLADDTVLLSSRAEDKAVLVAGTPFAGSENLPRQGDAYPLCRSVVLVPGAAEFSLSGLSRAEGFQALMKRAFCPFATGPIPGQIASMASVFSERVPMLRMASSLTHDLTGLERMLVRS